MSLNFQPGMTPETTFTPDNLIGGDAINAVTESIVVDTGVLARGSLLGKITATGKYILSASAATDGSEVPAAILAEDVDASSADVTTVAYLSGEFNATAMTFGTGHTAASTKDALRDKNIYLKTNLPA